MIRSDPVPLHAATLDRLPVIVDRAEVHRYLGYPRGAVPRAAVEASVEKAIGEARNLLRPRGAWAMYDVAGRDRRSLTIPPGVTVRGAIGEFLGDTGRVAVVVATAGPEAVVQAEAVWRSGDFVGALVWDALGSHIAENAADALAYDIRRHLNGGEALTLRYSPGYCGMDLDQQCALFRLVDAGAAGVRLLPTLIMDPVKSVSGLYGIGPADAVKARRSPCDACAMERCHMRR